LGLHFGARIFVTILRLPFQEWGGGVRLPATFVCPIGDADVRWIDAFC